VGTPPMPKFVPLPSGSGFKSAAVTSCERMMCGVTIITMSL
jgi:hypothetical protein